MTTPTAAPALLDQVPRRRQSSGRLGGRRASDRDSLTCSPDRRADAAGRFRPAEEDVPPRVEEASVW
ncbi:hypothetical protein [Streptomyces virginiae]|uniref:hypothetical protein n=1 Tax=Streptomyces virginiae TaxID=1961 RepID=UPI00342AEDB5